MSIERNHPDALSANNTSWWIDCLFISLVLGLLFFCLLGTRPLFVPDEGRYAEIAREMVASGDYITPHLNNIKYFEKPILFYWLGAIAIKLGGLNLWSLRSINALLSVLGCLATYFTGRKLYDRKTGLLAAFILGTSALYFVMGHMISLDLPVTFFLSLSLYAFLLGTQTLTCHASNRYPDIKLVKTKQGLTVRKYIWIAAIAAALAVLTKGLIGVVFPLMIIGMWMTLVQEWRLLKCLYLPSAIFIFLLITVPWHYLVSIRNPEFFYFYFIQQHFLRYTNPSIGHYQPEWFFIPTMVLGFFPWVVFLPQTFWYFFTSRVLPTLPRSSRQYKMAEKNETHDKYYKTEVFLVLWALLIFTFFSFSKSKLIPYILPVFPPLAILTARYLREMMLIGKSRGIKIGYLFLIILSLIITVTFYLFSRQLPPVAMFSATCFLLTAGGILCLGSLLSFYFAFKKISKAIVITIATTWLFLLITLASASLIDTRTIKPLAIILKSQLKPQDDVITYNQYYQDLPFYLERRVSILNWQNELNYGMLHQDTHDWMINDEKFWQNWHSQKRLFVIMSLDAFQEFKELHSQERVFVLGQTATNILISNQP